MQKQRGKRVPRRFLLRYFMFAFIMFVCMYVVFSALTGYNHQGSSSSPNVTLTRVSSTGSSSTGTLRSAMTATPSPISVATTATEYYQAIEAQSYADAYAFLDPNATGLSQAAFIQMALAADKAEGKVESFSVADFPPQVIMTVTRNIGPYHVHLLFQQEDNTWKIVSLDRI
jgi:hypothetical protein